MRVVRPLPRRLARFTPATSRQTSKLASATGRQTPFTALHEGRSVDGHLLTPAFPYPNCTHISRADSDDLYAYFVHSVVPVLSLKKKTQQNQQFAKKLPKICAQLSLNSRYLSEAPSSSHNTAPLATASKGKA